MRATDARPGAGGMWGLSPREQGGWAHHEGPLLLGCLKAAVAKLGGGVNELELDVLQGLAAVVHQEGLGPVGEGNVKAGGPLSAPPVTPSPHRRVSLTHLLLEALPFCFTHPALLERAGGQSRPPPAQPTPQPMGLPLPNLPPGTDLPQCDDPLLGARDATLQHDKVVVDLPVVREATLRERRSRKEALGLGVAEKTRGTPLAWGDTLDHIRTVSEPDPKSIL